MGKPSGKDRDMIGSLSIENFKGIRRVVLNDMTRLCLISGKNNIGKSSLLEAVFLLMDHSSNDSFAKLNGFRGVYSGETASLWDSLFHNLEPDSQIRLSVVEDSLPSTLTYCRDSTYVPVSNSSVPEDVLAQFRSAMRGSYSMKFHYKAGEYEENGHFSMASGSILRQMTTSLPGNEFMPMRPTRFLASSLARSLEGVADGIGRMELSGRKSVIVDILRELDSSIEDIVTVSLQGITQLHVRSLGKWIPIQFAGDGVLRLLQICLAVLEHENGLVLIDEIEAGFHYSAYGPLWKALETLTSQTGCQVLATTHSYEMIQAARNHVADEGCFSYYRLGKAANGIAAYRFNQSMLGSALDSEMEVR